MYLGVRSRTREESFLNKDENPPRQRIRTIRENDYWLEESQETVEDIYAQTDEHYTSVTYYDLQVNEDGTVSAVEVARG